MPSFPRLSTAELVKRESIFPFDKQDEIKMDPRFRGDDDMFNGRVHLK
jgi:hypothetical protein